MSEKETKRVMGFGTFDALHPGHLFYLEGLKKLGNELIIVIARDKNVERIKGKLPYFNEHVRLQTVKRTGIPSQVILGHPSDFYEVIREFNPAVLGFGYDQRVDLEKLQTTFPHIKMVRLEAYHPEKYKSSIIKKTLIGD